MVSLTGSVATGKWIARDAADTLKRVHLELGGKAPVVVLDDADPAAVAAGLRVGELPQLGPGLHRGRRASSPRPSIYDAAARGARPGGRVAASSATRPRATRSRWAR